MSRPLPPPAITRHVDFKTLGTQGGRWSFHQPVTETYVLISGLTCAIAIMLLYNLGIFISLRDRRYLYFILYGAANYLTLYTYGGFAYGTLWPESPAWHASCLQIFGAAQSATLLLFTRSYIDLPKHARSYSISRILEGVCWASILAIPFVAQSVSLQITSVISSLSHTVSLFIGIHSFEKIISKLKICCFITGMSDCKNAFVNTVQYRLQAVLLQMLAQKCTKKSKKVGPNCFVRDFT